MLIPLLYRTLALAVALSAPRTSTQAANVNSVPAANGLPRIAIDAGHGGEQSGARGICGVWEKNVTLEVARRVTKVLAASGRVQPILIRDTDTTLSLEARSARANELGATMFISIHANASTAPQARGIETFFLSLQKASGRLARLIERENEGRRVAPAALKNPLALVLQGLSLDSSHRQSQALAIDLQRSMVGHMRTRGRGVLQAPFLVLLGARMPAALIEVGFLTNAAECARLTSVSGQDEVAEAVAAGILTHLGTQRTLTAQAEYSAQGA